MRFSQSILTTDLLAGVRDGVLADWRVRWSAWLRAGKVAALAVLLCACSGGKAPPGSETYVVGQELGDDAYYTYSEVCWSCRMNVPHRCEGQGIDPACSGFDPQTMKRVDITDVTYVTDEILQPSVVDTDYSYTVDNPVHPHVAIPVGDIDGIPGSEFALWSPEIRPVPPPVGNLPYDFPGGQVLLVHAAGVYQGQAPVVTRHVLDKRAPWGGSYWEQLLIGVGQFDADPGLEAAVASTDRTHAQVLLFDLFDDGAEHDIDNPVILDLGPDYAWDLGARATDVDGDGLLDLTAAIPGQGYALVYGRSSLGDYASLAQPDLRIEVPGVRDGQRCSAWSDQEGFHGNSSITHYEDLGLFGPQRQVGIGDLLGSEGGGKDLAFVGHRLRDEAVAGSDQTRAWVLGGMATRPMGVLTEADLIPSELPVNSGVCQLAFTDAPTDLDCDGRDELWWFGGWWGAVIERLTLEGSRRVAAHPMLIPEAVYGSVDVGAVWGGALQNVMSADLDGDGCSRLTLPENGFNKPATHWYFAPEGTGVYGEVVHSMELVFYTYSFGDHDYSVSYLPVGDIDSEGGEDFLLDLSFSLQYVDTGPNGEVISPGTSLFLEAFVRGSDLAALGGLE